MSIASYFELSLTRAREIAAEVGQAVRSWRDHALQLGIAPGQIERMASAFEHNDLARAVNCQALWSMGALALALLIKECFNI